VADAKVRRATADRELASWRITVDRVYSVLMQVYVLAIVVLIYLAGEGIFGDTSNKIANAKSLDPHRALGSLLGLIAVVLFLIALAARINRATVIGALALAVLALVAQPALAGGGESNKWVGGFHIVDGVAIFLLSIWLAGQARRRTSKH
jgi:4-hydroxybenzoate polyprenyltransferase